MAQGHISLSHVSSNVGKVPNSRFGFHLNTHILLRPCCSVYLAQFSSYHLGFGSHIHTLLS
jgi:hypothetical protein